MFDVESGIERFICLASSYQGDCKETYLQGFYIRIWNGLCVNVFKIQEMYLSSVGWFLFATFCGGGNLCERALSEATGSNGKNAHYINLTNDLSH